MHHVRKAAVFTTVSDIAATQQNAEMLKFLLLEALYNDADVYAGVAKALEQRGIDAV